MVKYSVKVFLQGVLQNVLEVEAKSSLAACDAAEKITTKRFGSHFFCYEATPL